MTGWRSRGRGVGLGALFLLLLALGVEGWRAPSGPAPLKQPQHQRGRCNPLSRMTMTLAATTGAFAEGAKHDFGDVPAEALDEIEEPACRDMLARMRSWDVAVPTSVAPSGTVKATGVGPIDAARSTQRLSSTPPVVLLHGFDSSCLEFRRLHPLLDDHLDTFALDVMGWGFSQLGGVTSFSAEAKRAYLYGFWRDVLKGRKMVLAGASLGGAVAVDFAHAHPEAVEKLILIDGQVYIDGVGAMSSFPKPVASLGIQVLKSKPLRSYAGKLSYHDPETYSTLDAMRIGRVHCLRPGWEEASVSYMLSGGYSTSEKVKQIQAPTLVLWGAQDQILDPKLYANRFEGDMADCRLRFIDQCGHVCHLEKPLAAAEAIVEFVTGRTPDLSSKAPAVPTPTKAAASAGSNKGWFAGLADAWAATTGGGAQQEHADCDVCGNERVVSCGNCDDASGYYVTYGRTVRCNVCKGTGLVICRDCFNGDPYDIEGIRETVRAAAERMGRLPPGA